MDQAEIDRTEWQNPANWSGAKLLSVYFSKQDSRVWVPKQYWWAGWTLNLGRPAGVAWLVAIILIVVFAPLLGLALGVLLMDARATGHGASIHPLNPALPLVGLSSS